MKKTIYLKDENYNWKEYSYNNISELSEILKEKNISIGNGASIGSGASIGDDVKLITGLFINGSKHAVTYVGKNKISIGCHTKEIQWFKENYKLVGQKENYTEVEMQEYYNYILICEMFNNNLK